MSIEFDGLNIHSDLVQVCKTCTAGVTIRDISAIHEALENDRLNFLKYDVLHYEKIKKENLKKQKDEYGKSIFSKGFTYDRIINNINL